MPYCSKSKKNLKISVCLTKYSSLLDGLSPLGPILFGPMPLGPFPLSPLPLGPICCQSNCQLVQLPVGPSLTSPMAFWSTCQLVPMSLSTTTPQCNYHFGQQPCSPLPLSPLSFGPISCYHLVHYLFGPISCCQIDNNNCKTKGT